MLISLFQYLLIYVKHGYEFIYLPFVIKLHHEFQLIIKKVLNDLCSPDQPFKPLNLLLVESVMINVWFSIAIQVLIAISPKFVDFRTTGEIMMYAILVLILI